MNEQFDTIKLKSLKRENDLILEQLLKEGGEIEALHTQNRKLKEQNNELREALARAKEKASCAETDLAAIKKSLSWRLTAPVRSLLQLFFRK